MLSDIFNTSFEDEPDVIQHDFVLAVISSSNSDPTLRDFSHYLLRNDIIVFCDSSRQAQRLVAAAQLARYNNELS